MRMHACVPGGSGMPDALPRPACADICSAALTLDRRLSHPQQSRALLPMQRQAHPCKPFRGVHPEDGVRQSRVQVKQWCRSLSFATHCDSASARARSMAFGESTGVLPSFYPRAPATQSPSRTLHRLFSCIRIQRAQPHRAHRPATEPVTGVPTHGPARDQRSQNLPSQTACNHGSWRDHQAVAAERLGICPVCPAHARGRGVWRHVSERSATSRWVDAARMAADGAVDRGAHVVLVTPPLARQGLGCLRVLPSPDQATFVFLCIRSVPSARAGHSHVSQRPHRGWQGQHQQRRAVHGPHHGGPDSSAHRRAARVLHPCARQWRSHAQPHEQRT